jgi:regulation of enolase protein 1 (concanavalin A-like superfamily)
MRAGRRVALAATLALLALCLSLPAEAQIPGWNTRAFGDGTQGSATVDANGVWTVTGQSGDTWEREDNFFVVYKPLSGDGSITTRLLNAEEGAEWSRIGVMIRDDLEDPAAMTFQFYMTGGITPDPPHGVEANFRGVPGARMSKDEEPGPEGANRVPREFPLWLKVERRGDRLVGLASPDGQFWIPVTRSHQIPMRSEPIAGVFICSNNAGDSPLTATFDGKVTEVSSRLLKPEEASPLQPDPVITMGGENSVLLMWERVNHMGKDADGYVVWKAPVGGNDFVKIGELPGNQTSFIDDKIKNGEKARYRVTTIVRVGPAGDKILETQIYPGGTLALTPVEGAPNPGGRITIGGREYFASPLDAGGRNAVTAVPGSASIDSSGVLTLRAAGYNLDGQSDGGHQLLTPVTGDFTFTARVLGPPEAEAGDVNDAAKFGIAVRESPLADSRYAGMMITPTFGIRSPHLRLFTFGWSDDLTANEDIPTFPIHFRIQRRGTVIHMFTSADGNTFEPYGDPATTELIGFVANAYVGFMGSAHDDERPPDQVARARFDQITLTTP